MPFITWKDMVNATANPDGSLTKTSGTDGAYNAGAQSVERLDSSVGGFIERVARRDSRVLVGLTPDSTTISYTDIQYGWLTIGSTGLCQVFEMGASVTVSETFNDGDILRIEVRGSKVKYYRNGVLKYTSLVTPSGTYEVDASIYIIGSTVSPVDMGSLTWSAGDAINFHDWNRIESNISDLATYLNSIQYTVPTPSIVTNRTVSSIDYLSSINRIENNLGNIMTAFGMTPPNVLSSKTWAIGQGFTADDVNRLENNVQIIMTYGDLITKSWRRCGSFTTGDQGGLY